MEARSQYHHFIPRFVLREFASTAAGPGIAVATTGTDAAPKSNKKRNQKKKKKNKSKQQQPKTVADEGGLETEEVAGALEDLDIEEEAPAEKENTPSSQEIPKQRTKPKREKLRSGLGPENDPKNPLIKHYDMSKMVIEEQRIARVYGVQDLYRDLSAKDSNMNHIESKLGTLEQYASDVVRRIREYQKSRPYRNSVITLTRIELNYLRKFLFIMKYRHSLYWRKYAQEVTAYKEIDKPQIIAYMQRNNMSQLSEVWLRTMQVILDTEIDPEGSWQRTLMRDAFVLDAVAYIYHMTQFYLTLCEPSNADDEFVITDNGFGIHEGPTFITRNIQTGEEEAGSYTEYHLLAPLSPRLMLVLRSHLLLKGNERKLREHRMRPDVTNQKSLFEDLELEPAVPSYGANPVNFQARNDHTFSFKFHTVSRKYLNLFNGILLHEARESITWRTDSAMKRTMAAFIIHPQLKMIPRAVYIETNRDSKIHLEKLLRQGDEHAPKSQPARQNQVPKTPLPKDPIWRVDPPEYDGYHKLGGTHETLEKDKKAAKRLQDELGNNALKLKNTWSLEERNAGARKDMIRFSKQPAQVIYYYAKLWRANASITGLGPLSGLPGAMLNSMEDGPENLVANPSNKSFFRRLIALRGGELKDMMRTEASLFSQWGGFRSSCFLMDTPHYSNVGESIMSAKRSQTLKDPGTMTKIFSEDLEKREEIKKAGISEKRWAKTEQEKRWLQELLWKALWPTEHDLIELVIMVNSETPVEPECVIC
ncbi:hypothetical protein FPQ18DRAFT_386277 [Pyronema domesticum]|nr:hypothetical protein FPQ18DRAFT_386277 [Pyronema domesticum]